MVPFGFRWYCIYIGMFGLLTNIHRSNALVLSETF